jgi:hypothetical protein
MLADTAAPPICTGTSVGAPLRVLLERANSTANGVRMPTERILTVALAISAPGSLIRDPYARMPSARLTRDLRASLVLH